MLPKGSITSTTTIHETNYKLNVVTSHITIPRKKFDFFQFDFDGMKYHLDFINGLVRFMQRIYKKLFSLHSCTDPVYPEYLPCLAVLQLCLSTIHTAARSCKRL